MAKVAQTTHTMRCANLIANWIIKFNDPKKGNSALNEALQLMSYNGKDPKILTDLISNANIQNITYSDLLEINKIINKKAKVPTKNKKGA